MTYRPTRPLTAVRTLALLVFIVTIAAWLPTPAAGQSLSSISGTVTLTGAGVPDARVIAAGSVVRGATTSTDGNFNLAGLPAGTYSLSVEPAAISTTSPDWVFTAEPTTVRVPPSASGLSLTVTPATVTLTGTVLPPDGESFGDGSRVWVRAENQEGQGNRVLVDASGHFTVKALPGAILIRVITENPSWDDPTELSGLIFYAEDGETVVVDGDPATPGTDPIQLVLKSARISGAVTVAGSGTPAIGIPVRAWRLDGAEFETTLTDTQGRYTLPVIPGVWMLRAVPLEAQPYVPAHPPVRIVVAEGATATRDMQVAAADMVVQGQAVDSATGEPVADLVGRAYSTYRGPAGVPLAGPTAPLANGRFTLKLASSVATTYTIGLYLPPEAGYSAQSTVVISVADVPDELAIPVAASNASISGTLRDRSGQPLDGVAGAIYGVGEGGGWARTRINPANGTYQLPVTTSDRDGEGGTSWFLRAFVDPTSGYLVQRPRSQGVFVPHDGGSGSAVTGVDFTAVALAEFGAVRGQVLAPGLQGQLLPLAGVRVSAWPVDGSGAGSLRWDYTNARGEYELRLPAGSYRITAHNPPLRLPGNQLVEPAARLVTLAPRQQLGGQDLRFRRSDATVPGTLSYEGLPAAGIVRARSGDGAVLHVRAGEDGTFTLPLLSGQTWTIQAAGSDENLFLLSAKINLTPTAGQNPPLAIALELQDELPESQAFAFDAAADQLFTMGDGSRVEAPAGAFAEDGQALLTVRPLPDLASAAGAEPVRFGYRLHAFRLGDDDPQPITRFNRPVTLVIPFTAEQLAALGIGPEQLIPAYWDEASASWKPVETVAVVVDDTGGGEVLVSVEHFTDYALVTSAERRVHLPLLR